MDWLKISELQDTLKVVRDDKQLSLGKLEKEAGLRRGWCRNFIGGNPVTMRPKPAEVQKVAQTLARLKTRVAGLTTPLFRL